MSLTELHVTAARSAIAAAVLDALPDAALGDVSLRADQRLTLARAERAMREFGGCAIGDDVGRGKTYVALALARQWSRPLVVAPAALRDTWGAATGRARVACQFISHEALSRRGAPECDFDGIIVDESHHFRTTTTARYSALVGLAAQVPIVLLSATPLQNRARDLAAQIALFHGERAFTLTDAELSRFVIRSDAEIPGMPVLLSPEWISLDVDDGPVLNAIIKLPSPARPRDGGVADALRTMGLVRAWASSRAALDARIRARRRTATAIEQSLEAGRLPTRMEIRAWHGYDDAIQLGFAALLAGEPEQPAERSDVRAMLERDFESMRTLSSALLLAPDPDLARVDALRALRTRFPNARIIAFSEFSATIAAFFGLMRRDAGVGMLTSRVACIASGRIGRDELLRAFAPKSQGGNAPHVREAVTLLLATDLLAEGVNLQDAEIVVHLDMPWNPQKMAQRVGRIRRPGGAETVRSFVFAPPANAAVLLDADARLRKKLATSSAVVGDGLRVLPALEDTLRVAAPSSAADEGALMDHIARWRRPRRARAHAPVVAGVRSADACWLAALDDGRLMCAADSTAPSLGSCAHAADAPSRPVDRAERERTVQLITDVLANERVLAMSGCDAAPGPLRRAVIQWLDGLVRSQPRHRLPLALPLISQLREHLHTPFALGAERRLAEISVRQGDDVLALLREAQDVACRRGGSATTT